MHVKFLAHGTGSGARATWQAISSVAIMASEAKTRSPSTWRSRSASMRWRRWRRVWLRASLDSASSSRFSTEASSLRSSQGLAR